MYKQLLLTLALVLSSGQAFAAKTQVAVASNFIAPMRALAERFEQQTGHTVLLSFGSSAKLYAQIRHGAPFDVFLSADQDKPATLIKDGWVTKSPAMTYAQGTLVLWSTDAAMLRAGPEALKAGRFRKLALANPRLAPYGQAAVDVLRKLEIESHSRSKWVMGENIAQTFQFVASGNADLGFIAASQWAALADKMTGSAWHVDPNLHAPILQDAVILDKASDNPAAKALMAFLSSDDAQRLIESFGYLPQDPADV